MKRPYDEIARRVANDGERNERMQSVVDALWDTLEHTGVSWVGFYRDAGGDELVLGPLRNSPACSPIGLHGVCGRAFRTREAVVVRDVRELGDRFIACDPRDRSEVVVPLLEADRTCWGVLDLDSHEIAAFTDADVVGLREVLRAARLTGD